MDAHVQTYTCEHRNIAKFIIPNDATADDLAGIKELLDVIIARHFKHTSGKENTEEQE